MSIATAAALPNKGIKQVKNELSSVSLTGYTKCQKVAIFGMVEEKGRTKVVAFLEF